MPDEFLQATFVDDKEYFHFIANIFLYTLSNDNAVLLPDFI